jgi:hypothetical protein
VLNITAPLVVLDKAVCQGYGGIKLCLLDTPGPNEAGEEGLKYQVGHGFSSAVAAVNCFVAIWVRQHRFVADF